MAISMGLPCPMCLRNPERYESTIRGNCRSPQGFPKLSNVIQHLIESHLHICRVCTQHFSFAKSVKGYKEALENHTDCHQKKWPIKYDTEEPEILTLAQQNFVLSWKLAETRRGLEDVCPVGVKASDRIIFEKLYESLHSEPLKADWTEWRYWAAAHQKDKVIATLKQKQGDLEQRNNELEQEVAWLRKCMGHFNYFPELSKPGGETVRSSDDPLAKELESLRYINPQLLNLESSGQSSKQTAILREGLVHSAVYSADAWPKLPDSGFCESEGPEGEDDR